MSASIYHVAARDTSAWSFRTSLPLTSPTHRGYFVIKTQPIGVWLGILSTMQCMFCVISPYWLDRRQQPCGSPASSALGEHVCTELYLVCLYAPCQCWPLDSASSSSFSTFWMQFSGLLEAVASRSFTTVQHMCPFKLGCLEHVWLNNGIKSFRSTVYSHFLQWSYIWHHFLGVIYRKIPDSHLSIKDASQKLKIILYSLLWPSSALCICCLLYRKLVGTYNTPSSQISVTFGTTKSSRKVTLRLLYEKFTTLFLMV